MLSDHELNHTLGIWMGYTPSSAAQAGNTIFMKSETNDVNPGSSRACYNTWQLRLQITWLLEHRGQPVVVPRTRAAMLKQWAGVAGRTFIPSLLLTPLTHFS